MARQVLPIWKWYEMRNKGLLERAQWSLRLNEHVQMVLDFDVSTVFTYVVRGGRS